MRPVYKVLEIKEDRLVVFQSLKTGEIIFKKISIPKFAKVGDLIRKVEHYSYDVIDKDGEIIWRK